MQKLLHRSILFSSLCLLGLSCIANNIRVKKLSLSDTVTASKDIKIKFDLSWENSWRDDINWDAAWITAKVKRPDGSWKHIKFQALGNTIDGNPQNAKIVVPDDKMGAFIYRSGKGTGNIDLASIKLAWNYGVDSVSRIDTAEIRLFATEMVYVPQGSFAFGDSYTPSSANMYYMPIGGNIVTSIFQNFTAADTVKFGQNTPMFTIISDKNTPKLSAASTTNMGAMNTGDQVIINGIYINGLKGIGIETGEIFKYPNFPVGYKAFYCMKYETSQGQYTDFLNTTKINITTQNYPMPGMGATLLPQPYSASQPLARFSIEKQGENYIVSRPDRAMDYVNGTQLFAFANWSSLRPMTELEFEKAARGPLAPTSGDRANGKEPIHFPGGNPEVIYRLKLNSAENGAESPLGVDSTKFLANIYDIEGGDGGSGAYRVGVFATSTSSRRSSGASYYGVIGLTDNVAESVISLNTEISRSFKDVNGLGENSSSGNPAVNHWLNTSWMISGQSMVNKGSGVSYRGSSTDRSGFRSKKRQNDV